LCEHTFYIMICSRLVHYAVAASINVKMRKTMKLKHANCKYQFPIRLWPTNVHVQCVAIDLCILPTVTNSLIILQGCCERKKLGLHIFLWKLQTYSIFKGSLISFSSKEQQLVISSIFFSLQITLHYYIDSTTLENTIAA
jgi:hypothetical protein